MNARQPLSGQRYLILVDHDYEDLELWYPKLRLIEAGAHTVVPAPRPTKSIAASMAILAGAMPRSETWNRAISTASFCPVVSRPTNYAAIRK